MQRAFTTGVCCALAMGLPIAWAGVGTVFHHQGVVAVDGERFTGFGAFRFALVNPVTDEYLWVNDGSAVAHPDPPVNAITLPVVGGVYQVRLGDAAIANMTDIPPAIINENADITLRIWFDDQQGHGTHRLSPDLKIAAVPFVYQAATSAQLNIPGTSDPAVFVNGIGDVGIGTSTPQRSLDVLKPGGGLRVGQAVGQSLDIKSFDGALTDVPGSPFGMQLVGPTSGQVVLDLQANDSQDGLYVRAPTTIQQPPGEVDKTVAVVTGAGRVGIGTNDPEADLHVSASPDDVATLWVAGTGQSAGMIYVGQEPTHGGGIAYDGDANPDIVGGVDRITIFRRDAGADHEVLSFKYDSNDVTFNGNIEANQDVIVPNGDVIITGGGLCVDGDGACTSPGPGGLRVGAGGITGTDSSNDNLLLVPNGGNVLVPGGGNVGIGTTDPQAGLDVQTSVSIFGSWQDGYNLNTVYFADTDGFVVAVVSRESNVVVIGYTEANNPPLTVRARQDIITQQVGQIQYASITMPVRKGDYWQVEALAPVRDSTIWWLPLGTAERP